MNEQDETVIGGSERPEDIERRIETTRQRMSRDIDAISNKLRPANLADQAGEAITGKARRTGSGLVGMARDNPLPALAVGASLAWLIYSARQGDTDSETHVMHESTYTGVERRIGGYQNMSGFRRRFDDFEGRNRIERVKDAAGRITGDVGEKAHELTQRAGEVADTAKERVAVVADHAKAEGRRRMHQIERQTHEHPLKVAAGAALAGLALGLLLPVTQKENEVMGSARDELVDRAEETASRVKDVAAEGARHVAETVKSEARAHAPELKSMAQDLKQQVAGQVKETATRAREEAKDAIRSNGGDGAPSAGA